MARYLLLGLCFVLGNSCSPGPVSITGSARLPECSDAPATDLSGGWFDQGTLTITSTGCEAQQAPIGSVLDSCALNWEMTQDGNAVDIVVDEEYRLKGRICGNTLHLEGGWWLPLRDEQGQCNYDDEDGSEVGIEMGGSSLEIGNDSEQGEFLDGTLALRAQCTGEYQVRFNRLRR